MSMKKIIELIQENHSILISVHVSPDLDALCSQLAMAIYLRQLGKRVSMVNECEVPTRYKFLVGSNKIKKHDQVLNPRYDLIIILDCGELRRIGKVANLITDEMKIINIDHHLSNNHFGDINWVVPEGSSTAEVLFSVLKYGRCSFNKNLSAHLYTGIMADTGSFRYSNTTPQTHQIVSELREYNFSADKIYKNIYESIPFNDFCQFVKIVGDFEASNHQKVICFELDKKRLAKFSQDFDLRDTMLNFLRLVKGVELIVMFSEISKNMTRVNLRSYEKVNVAKLASLFGGGGHKRASGCRIDKTMKESKAMVLKEVKKVI